MMTSKGEHDFSAMGITKSPSKKAVQFILPPTVSRNNLEMLRVWCQPLQQREHSIKEILPSEESNEVFGLQYL